RTEMCLKSEKDDAFGIFGISLCDIPSARETEPSEEPFDIDPVPKEVKSQLLAEKKAPSKKLIGLGVLPSGLTSGIEAYNQSRYNNRNKGKNYKAHYQSRSDARGLFGASPANVSCQICHGIGHFSPTCPMLACFARLQAPGSTPSAFTGLQIGPPAQQQAYLPGTSTGYFQQPPYDHECYPDTVNRALRFDSSNLNYWLHNNIFRKRNIAKGRLCEVILDCGATKNFLAKELVEKLKLETFPRTEPSDLTCLSLRQAFRRRVRVDIHDRSTRLYPFMIVQGRLPDIVLDLAPIPPVALVLSSVAEFPILIQRIHDNAYGILSTVPQGNQ
ncbi:hypothetical protein GIB67_018149, partial [Kingdonia uniflora]